MRDLQKIDNRTGLSSFIASLDFLIQEAKNDNSYEIVEPLQKARGEIALLRKANDELGENFTDLFKAFKCVTMFMLIGTTEQKQKCVKHLDNINRDFLEEYHARENHVQH